MNDHSHPYPLSVERRLDPTLSLVACGIGLPFTLFYSLLVNHHLYGQAYRQASGVLPGDNQPPQPYPPALPS